MILIVSIDFNFCVYAVYLWSMVHRNWWTVILPPRPPPHHHHHWVVSQAWWAVQAAARKGCNSGVPMAMQIEQVTSWKLEEWPQLWLLLKLMLAATLDKLALSPVLLKTPKDCQNLVKWSGFQFPAWLVDSGGITGPSTWFLIEWSANTTLHCL